MNQTPENVILLQECTLPKSLLLLWLVSCASEKDQRTQKTHIKL